MAPSAQQPRWRRIHRQTLVLIHKNLLILSRAWIATLCRALLFPIAVAVIFSVLKHISQTESSFGVSNFGISTTSYPVKNLSDAIAATSKAKLVFVRNGIAEADLSPFYEPVITSLGSAVETHVVDDPNELFTLCKQALSGSSDCFAAVLFLTLNQTDVEYSIVLDPSIGQQHEYGNFRTENSLYTNRVLPIQSAINAHIGNISPSVKFSTQPFSGYFGPNSFIPPSDPPTNGPFWLSLVQTFVAPIFILIVIGVVYHLSTFVATERETSMSELLEAQNVTTTPRILSTLTSFFAIYFPGLLASSIIITQVLFIRTSDILFLFIFLLGGGSIITSSHFIASFFGKAQLAGLYSSTLVFALALISLSASLSNYPKQHYNEVLGLSIFFPPITFANFIGDVAGREYNLHGFSLLHKDPVIDSVGRETSMQKIDGYLYIIFFIIQTFAYGAGTYFVERKLWGVKRNYDLIESTSDVALRCTGLTKTYYGKRPWYWPFMRKGDPNVAINNLDLEVKQGSVTFLLGPNGGGKTTTLKCVAGMTGMDTGSRLELNEGGLVFGICPQSNVFWDSLTVQEHIMIWRKLKTAAFDDSTADADDDVLAECDLMLKAQARAKTLSGGQMRKLQLAIAFVGGSKVCCIDEASSGLDPLSRRHIWNIIQKGHARRTILVTTHFLDEADVLADHIAIVYKGRLVCEGPGTSLKARFGDDYIIRSEADEHGDNMVWRTTNSADATRKILELEAITEDHTYDVVFPTLEQVFLKVTSDSNTAIHDNGGDGIVGEEQTITAIDEKIFALEQGNARDIDLESGHTIGLARQVAALFCKRYILLQQKAGWISYGISLIIPIIVAAALVKFVNRFHPLQTCADNAAIFRNESLVEGGSSSPLVFGPLDYSISPYLYSYQNTHAVFLGPEVSFTGAVQDNLYSSAVDSAIGTYSYDSYGNPSTNETLAQQAFALREFVNGTDDMVFQITNASGVDLNGFGIYAPTPDHAILYHSTYSSPSVIGLNMIAFDLITNRIINATAPTGSIGKHISTTVRTFRTPANKVNFLAMPISVLVSLAFVASVSIAVIYPAFERINNVRALQYCNGVSPFALWFGYLLFDMQVIIVQSIIVWGMLFAGSVAKVWYAPEYLLGVFILFGIASYLGTYVLSLYTKKAAFAIAAGLHTLLFVLYLAAYIMNQSFGDKEKLFSTYSYIQYGLGLSSPGANLARAIFLTTNSFEILCGKYADADTSAPFAYVRYGSVYANLLIQIIFLIAVLVIHEYGSADWFRRNIFQRGVPARLHYIVEADAATANGNEKTSTANPTGVLELNNKILEVSQISKFFGSLFAVENVSFSISSNQTLALLGGNGAGKTTVINMIRGELVPNFGTISLDGISVLKNPHKARLHMGVCPQDDAVDNLTVRQTLEFYATVKGLRDREANVEKVLIALNITSFEHTSVKDLSGGTRRKLSVAIALLGNPRVLLLDEPSTGQDAGAKRILWRALKDVSVNRAILLTTHSMEEAEALATGVAILGGRMLATGTLNELQEQYGGQFMVRAVRSAGLERDEVETLIKERFDGKVSGYEDAHGEISWRLPHERHLLGSIMRIMEELKGENFAEEEDTAYGSGAAAGGSGNIAVGGSVVQEARGGQRVISDYTISGPTLEEVFMNVAKESGVGGGV